MRVRQLFEAHADLLVRILLNRIPDGVFIDFGTTIPGLINGGVLTDIVRYHNLRFAKKQPDGRMKVTSGSGYRFFFYRFLEEQPDLPDANRALLDSEIEDLEVIQEDGEDREGHSWKWVVRVRA